LKAGKDVVIFDQADNEYLARIESISNKSVVLNIKEELKRTFSDKAFLTVACAIPKKSKFDDIIDKLTQLGVDRIIPMLTERVIVKLDSRKAALRKARWEKIALSACQQCKRKNIPVIDMPESIGSVLSSAGFDLKLIPSLQGKRRPLKEVLGQVRLGSSSKILLLIGPEGDFTDDELKSAFDSGFIPVSLGSCVLRVETAAIAAAGFIRLYEDR